MAYLRFVTKRIHNADTLQRKLEIAEELGSYLLDTAEAMATKATVFKQVWDNIKNTSISYFSNLYPDAEIFAEDNYENKQVSCTITIHEIDCVKKYFVKTHSQGYSTNKGYNMSHSEPAQEYELFVYKLLETLDYLPELHFIESESVDAGGLYIATLDAAHDHDSFFTFQEIYDGRLPIVNHDQELCKRTVIEALCCLVSFRDENSGLAMEGQEGSLKSVSLTVNIIEAMSGYAFGMLPVDAYISGFAKKIDESVGGFSKALDEINVYIQDLKTKHPHLIEHYEDMPMFLKRLEENMCYLRK